MSKPQDEPPHPEDDPREIAPPPTSTDSNVIHKQGWGKKQSGFLRQWKRRWFVLRGFTLHYYVKEDGEEQGQIDLMEAKRVERAPECKTQPALKIEGLNQVDFIVYDTPQEVVEWIEVMNKVCFPAYLDE
jgi:hypothetical protein